MNLRRPTHASLPEVVERVYQLWLWLDARVMSFPASARASLGAHLLDHVLRVLDHTTRAAWLPRDAPTLPAVLNEANHRVAMARMLLRGAHDRRHLSDAQHAFAAEQLHSIGRQIGAWRAARRRSLPPTSPPGDAEDS